jgi:hypothetical protein
MTDKTTEPTDANDEPEEYNPWTANLKGWQKHAKIPGNLLPKKLLRPYWFLPPIRLDDKQYMYPDGGDLKSALGMVYGFAYLIAFACVFVWLLSPDDSMTELYVSVAAFLLAIPTNLYTKKLEHDRYCIFDREKGIVISEWGWYKKKERVFPFHECEGRLYREAHVYLMHFGLYLYHPSESGFIRLMSTSTLDEPLGYWSFLLQYMDKNKPLPDIPLLKDYPEREPGLGSREEWKELEKQPDFIDPYALWLAELEQHPEWDKVNYGRELKSDWWQQLIFALVVLAITVLIAYVMIVLTT